MKFRLRLYVTGQTSRSLRAMQNLKRICESDLSGDYDLEIVDVLERPQIAEDQKVLVTPTVDRILPPPIRRIIGDLSDKDKVLVGLELEQVVS